MLPFLKEIYYLKNTYIYIYIYTIHIYELDIFSLIALHFQVVFFVLTSACRASLLIIIIINFYHSTVYEQSS